MASEFFSDIASTVLSKTMDTASARQKAIANNIANVETPGYKRSKVTFEDELKSVLSRNTGHSVREGLKSLYPVCEKDAVNPAGANGNNVNIDAEIADLAKTTLKHKAAAVLLDGKISMLRSAIMEGKR